MAIIIGVIAIKYYLIDQKEEVMVGGGVEKQRKRRGKSKGEPEENISNAVPNL